MYFIKTPEWLKKIYSGYVWDIKGPNKVLYLSFDDGPHPEATPFVLETLKNYDAKATFFCIGKNVAAEPDLYQQILLAGHAVGNHTHNHLNGWKTQTQQYLENINEAEKYIDALLFRPPYGRIKRSQGRALQAGSHTGRPFRVIMWDVLSGDFDETITAEKCLQNVTGTAVPGSIIVFHDSAKAFKNMAYALPRVLDFFSEKGYRFHALDLQ